MPFSFRRVSKKYLIALVLLVLLVGMTFALSTRRWAAQVKPAPPPNASVDRKAGYLNRVRLVPQLREALRVLGDRLEKPGKERLTLIGQLERKPDEKHNIRLILEFPDKLRLEEPEGVTVYDGKQLKSTKKNRNSKDDDEIESLLSDSFEHFLTGQSKGQATRFLGSRFRLDDGTTPKYDGPFYEVYLVSDAVKVKKETAPQPKQYYLNSDTLLLERVRYELPETQRKVEVQWLGWQKSGEYFLPSKMIRQEDGAVTFSLMISSAVLEAKREDGIFTLP